MKFSKKIVAESLNQKNTGKRVFTKGKRQNVVLSEEQLDRLLSSLEETKQNSIEAIIKECHQLIRESITSESLDLGEQGQYNRDPGIAAGEGLEVVLDGIKRAYDMIKDSDTRKKLANSITKLGNFMTITADAMASGRDQRGMRSADSLRDDLPYPELDEEVNEGAKPDFLDLDKDGDTEESMKKAAGEVEESYDEEIEEGMTCKSCGEVHEGDCAKDIKEHNETLIREEIKRMKQIIKPIRKI
mgnify:CR=1 FL=1